MQPSAFASVRDAIGQIPAVPIEKDSQVLGTVMTNVGRSLATKIPRGMRAVSLAVTDVTGVSSLVAANNYVDVLATVKLGSGLGSSNQRTFVTTLFQNVMVLAVGSDLGEVRKVSPDQDAMAALAQQEKERFSTVTLALTPQQAQDLVLAQDIGDISLALRSFRDENETAAIPRSNAAAVFGVTEGEVVPRRTPSWQEIRGTVR
jgi:pilus assembly protein CpaB